MTARGTEYLRSGRARSGSAGLMGVSGVRPRWLRQGLVSLLLACSAALLASPALAQDRFWSALRQGGHLVLMRHALAPGTGDPAGFRLGDCSTQRNLDARGREQARRIGELFRAQGIASARLYSSQWCRCVESAEEMALGEVTALPLLNSFFRDRSTAAQQTEQLRQWIQSQPLDQPLVLVTHQVNITALTGVFPSSGELVLIDARGEQPVVVATLETR